MTASSGVAAAAAAAAAAALSHAPNGGHMPDSGSGRNDDEFLPKRQTRSATAAAAPHAPAASPAPPQHRGGESMMDGSPPQLPHLSSQAPLMNLLPFPSGSYNPYVAQMAGAGGFPPMGMYQLPAAPPGFLMGPPGMVPSQRDSSAAGAGATSGDGADSLSVHDSAASRFQQKKGALSIHIPEKVAGKPVRESFAIPSAWSNLFCFSATESCVLLSCYPHATISCIERTYHGIVSSPSQPIDAHGYGAACSSPSVRVTSRSAMLMNLSALFGCLVSLHGPILVPRRFLTFIRPRSPHGWRRW